MKAIVNFPPVSFDAEVTLYDQRPEGAVVYNLDGSVREQVPLGSEPVEPSAIINRDALEAIVAAASDHLPPSQATDRHLADAIKVRDQLLDADLPQRERGAA